MPLHMRIPKRGFNNIFGTDFAIVNLGQIQKLVDAKKLDAKKTVDHDALKAAGVARGGKDGVRLLAKGELTAKLNFAVAGASKGAIEAVEKAGGKVRSEEHTSELQSLMRISYAVFCLNKKKQKRTAHESSLEKNTKKNHIIRSINNR